MRVNRSNSAEEEKAYCATYGADLFRLSYLDDKVGRGDADERESMERNELAAAVPSDVVADYRAGRARNHAINRLMLEWAADGVVDYALIGQDDTAAYGWNIAEARELRRLIDRDGLWQGVDDVTLATLEWVAWYNNERLHSACGDIPPKEFEENYYNQQTALVA